MARELKRINTNIPLDMLERIDEYAESLCINRTAAMLVLLNTGLNQSKAVKTMEDMINLIKVEQKRNENKDKGLIE